MSKKKAVSQKLSTFPEDYTVWVLSLKKRIAGARQKALLAANAEQIKFLKKRIDCAVSARIRAGIGKCFEAMSMARALRLMRAEGGRY